MCIANVNWHNNYNFNYNSMITRSRILTESKGTGDIEVKIIVDNCKSLLTRLNNQSSCLKQGSIFFNTYKGPLGRPRRR